MSQETVQNEVVGNDPMAKPANSAAKVTAPHDENSSGEISNRDAAMSNPLPPKEAGHARAKREAQTAAHEKRQAEVAAESMATNGLHYEEVEADKGLDPKDRVKIQPALNIPKCRIAGKWYSFEKGKIYTVPKAVKAALLKRPGNLMPTY
jgi:hypothetical protein